MNLLKQIKISAAVFFILFSFFQCAFAINLDGPYKQVETPIYQIGGAEYIPVLSLCEAYGLDWDWDSISGVLTLKKDTVRLQIKENSNILHSELGEDCFLRKPFIFREGVALLPLASYDSIKKIIERDFSIVSPKAPVFVEPAFLIKKVVIDPGHGGKDPGAIGYQGVKEKNIVLDIAFSIREELENNGIEVVMTRDRDIFVPLAKRAKIANQSNADFFISIHANAAKQHRAGGIEIFYMSEASDEDAKAMANLENLALKYEDPNFSNDFKNANGIVGDLIYQEKILESKELANCVILGIAKRANTKYRGVKSARFYVLKYTNMPSILVEVGFVTNKHEALKLSNDNHRESIAHGIVSGILKYKKEYEETEGFTK